MKSLGHWGVVCAFVITGLTLAGCKSGPVFTDLPGVGETARGGGGMTAPQSNPGTGAAVNQQPANQAPVNQAAANELAPMDMIHRGDTLQITFADLPYQQPPIIDRVKEDGTITLLQNRTFMVAGKTRGELEKEIRATYVPAYFREMTVTVLPQTQTQFYYVGGEVKSPGQRIYLGRTTVLQAIQASGDFTDFANRRNIQLTRPDGKTFRIDGKKALSDPTLDLQVFPNDRINVYRRKNPFWQ